VTLSSAS
jgi:DNA-directed RNA polymerase subunit RPC12/RpoP